MCGVKQSWDLINNDIRNDVSGALFNNHKIIFHRFERHETRMKAGT